MPFERISKNAIKTTRRRIPASSGFSK